MTTIYGLDTCDTCRKARNGLGHFGVAGALMGHPNQNMPVGTFGEWERPLAFVVPRGDRQAGGREGAVEDVVERVAEVRGVSGRAGGLRSR